MVSTYEDTSYAVTVPADVSVVSSFISGGGNRAVAFHPVRKEAAAAMSPKTPTQTCYDQVSVERGYESK